MIIVIKVKIVIIVNNVEIVIDGEICCNPDAMTRKHNSCAQVIVKILRALIYTGIYTIIVEGQSWSRNGDIINQCEKYIL